MKSLYRNKWITIASIGVVGVTLLMLGTFLAVSLNIDQITMTVKEQVEIAIFIDDEATLEDREQLRTKLKSHTALSEVRFVSKEEAMERLEEIWGDFVAGYKSAEANPLRDSYEVRPTVPEEVTALAQELEGYPGVAKVEYGEEEFLNNLFTIIRILQMVGLALMAGLAVTAVFLIAHTIKLTVFIRKREIMIMKYVGATNWFIRWPFVLEGFTIGLVGAIFPMVGLYYIYQASVDWVVSHNLFFLSLVPVSLMGMELAKYLLPLGTGLGILGSLLSMDRFLRV